MTGNVENTKKVLDFIAKELSRNTFVSLMAQYHHETFCRVKRKTRFSYIVHADYRNSIMKDSLFSIDVCLDKKTLN